MRRVGCLGGEGWWRKGFAIEVELAVGVEWMVWSGFGCGLNEAGGGWLALVGWRNRDDLEFGLCGLFSCGWRGNGAACVGAAFTAGQLLSERRRCMVTCNCRKVSTG